MKKLIVIGVLLILSGCYTIKTAEKQLIKAKVHYPEMVASTYSSWYPIKTDTFIKVETRPGKDIVRYDTIEVDCDSAMKEKTSIVKVPFEVSKYRVDTIYNTTTSTIESTAKLEEAKAIIKSVTTERDEAYNKISSLRSAKNIFLIAMIASIALNLFLLYFKSLIRI